MDVATFTDLTASTGGSLYYYPGFTPSMDHDQVGAAHACMKGAARSSTSQGMWGGACRLPTLQALCIRHSTARYTHTQKSPSSLDCAGAE